MHLVSASLTVPLLHYHFPAFIVTNPIHLLYLPLSSSFLILSIVYHLQSPGSSMHLVSASLTVSLLHYHFLSSLPLSLTIPLLYYFPIFAITTVSRQFNAFGFSITWVGPLPRLG